MNSWKRVSAFADFSTKGITPNYVDRSSTVVLNQKCIRNHRINYDLAQYTHDKQTIADEKFVKEGDILINSTGAGTAGRCAFVSELPKGKRITVDSHILILRCGSYYAAQCLSYVLFSFEEKLMSFMTGSSGQSELDKVVLMNLKTEMTEDPVKQKEIAAVLSALDAKIELNQRINAELEAMAKTLYDYWFVQFDFPNEKGKPYKSSGGKMVFEKALKREIPFGWIGANILSVAELLGGGTPTKKESRYWGGKIPFFTPTDADGSIYKFATEDYITEEGLNNSSTRLYDPNTVFITARGSVGRLVLTGVPMAMNQSCYALKAKPDLSYAYLYFLVKELIHHLEVKASGSVFDSIVSNDIEYTKLAIPEVGVMKKYAQVAEPIFELIAKNIREINLLSEIRDWLLPMLMNGQVSVSEGITETSRKKSHSVTNPQAKESNPLFKRGVLGAYIINQSLEDVQFGDTKFEKLLYLADSHVLKRDFGQNYFQQAAGPYDNKFTRWFWSYIDKQKWFKRTKQGSRYVFEPGEAHQKSKNLYNYFSDNELQDVNKLLGLFKESDYQDPEIVSTLYAVWNNRILRHRDINDNDLIKDFYAWDVGKKKYPQEKLEKTLAWMRKESIVPDGWGKIVNKQFKK